MDARAAGDAAANRELRKHADSEHAAATVPALAFADRRFAPRYRDGDHAVGARLRKVGAE